MKPIPILWTDIKFQYSIMHKIFRNKFLLHNLILFPFSRLCFFSHQFSVHSYLTFSGHALIVARTVWALADQLPIWTTSCPVRNWSSASWWATARWARPGWSLPGQPTRRWQDPSSSRLTFPRSGPSTSIACVKRWDVAHILVLEHLLWIL